MYEALLEWLMRPLTEDIPVTLEDLLRRPAWHRRAACRGCGWAEFVRSHGTTYGSAHKAMCERCPVQEPCLEFALENDVVGLWGGLNDSERRKLKRAGADGPG